jgi:hypothetical protein
LTAAIDEVIARFNKKQMDLPDGFFDRRAQLLINGAAFETLLGQSPADPLILMLARGPAGYRFTAKGVQHAMPDARVERGDIVAGGDPFTLMTRLWLSGTLHTTGEPLNEIVDVTLRLNAAGQVDVAAATMDLAALEKIRAARRF